MTTDLPPAVTENSVKSAFGAENRNRLIDLYFGGVGHADVLPARAWFHVYRLLLWIDQTTGLAHCYESDKCQPGKPWYARSLAFHDWACKAFDTTPSKLAAHLDWLFIRVTKDLAAEVLQYAKRASEKAAQQRAPYAYRDFPKPGEDPELVAIVKRALGDAIAHEPSADEWQRMVEQIRQYITLENKRKNLVGEGFEDVLAQVLRRTCRQRSLQVHARRLLHDIPGFSTGRKGDKPIKVDVALTRPSMRTLITAKWSIRADREKQFPSDFNEYVKAESDRKPFEYVLVTNEFDPARLCRACEQLVSNARMFDHVVHISTSAIAATYGAQPNESMRKVLQFIEQGRLISVERWIASLENEA